MISTSEDRGTTQIPTVSRKALTTQMEAAGLAWSCTAILGSAVLAMLPSSTDMAKPTRELSIAHRRCVLGKPSVKPISLETGIVISDICTAPLPGQCENARLRERLSPPLANQADGIRQVSDGRSAGIRIS